MEPAVLEGSVPSFSTELNLFELLPTDIGTLSSEYYQYYPVSTFRDSTNAISFHIPASSNMYTFLKNSFIYAKLRITLDNGEKCESDHTVTGCNHMYSALWDSVEILFNNTPVTRAMASGLYPYKGYLETLLTYGKGPKESTLSSELWMEDKGVNNFKLDENPGFKTRFDITKQSKSFELIGKIYDSIWSVNRFIPSMVDIKITLNRSNPHFALVGVLPAKKVAVAGAPVSTTPEAKGYSIQFEDICLYEQKFIVNPQILNLHQQALNAGQRFQYVL